MNLVMNEEYICVFCLQDWADDQIFCCDTYKGILSKSDYVKLYGELDQSKTVRPLCQNQINKQTKGCQNDNTKH